MGQGGRARAGAEIWRLDLGFMTAAWERGSVAGGRPAEAGPDTPEPPVPLPESAGRTAPGERGPRAKEGDG